MTIYLQLSTTGDHSFRFADDTLIPANPDFLKDASSDTCTAFQQNDLNSDHGFTQFRVNASIAEIGSINVIITGNGLECGRNLYVSPISSAESESWLGRWTRFKLEKTTENDNKQRCFFWFNSTGPVNEIQVIRTPLPSKDVNWEICHISIMIMPTGEQT